MSEWIVEVLERPTIAVDDSSDPAILEQEMGERLEALLASHMLEPTPDGWRSLALALAMEHEPLFAIETPMDRSSLGGRPVGMNNFILRSSMKQEIRKLKAAGISRGAQKRAAAIVAKAHGVSAGTANNAMSRRSASPDSSRRAPYVRKAERALNSAAARLSSQV